MARRPTRGPRPATPPPEPPEAPEEPASAKVSPSPAPLHVAEPAPGALARPTLFDPDRPAAEPDWRSALAGRRPGEILARLVDGDPLALRPAVCACLRRGAWLLDADRVHLRAIARCAQRGVEYRGDPPWPEWIRAVVDEAVLDLLREDAEAHAAGADPSPDEEARLATLARPLGLDVRVARAAVVAFHRASLDVRLAFVRIVIEGQTPQSVAREFDRDVAAVTTDARRALESLLAAEDEVAGARSEAGGSS